MQTPFADPTQLTHIKYAYTSRNKTNFSKKMETTFGIYMYSNPTTLYKPLYVCILYFYTTINIS